MMMLFKFECSPTQLAFAKMAARTIAILSQTHLTLIPGLPTLCQQEHVSTHYDQNN